MLRQACWVVALHAAYVVAVGGDWMPEWRFVLPVLPLLALLAQAGLWRSWDAVRPRVAVPAPAFGAAVVAFLAVLGTSVFRHPGFEGAVGDEYRPADARAIGRQLAADLPRDKTVALDWGGVLPYFAPHDCLELYGLTDHELARADVKRTRWGVRPLPDDVARRRPDVILPCLRLYPTARAAADDVHRVGKLRGRRYCSPTEMSPHGYRLRIVRHGPEAFWPLLTRDVDIGADAPR
jgi:hypothetical protein